MQKHQKPKTVSSRETATPQFKTEISAKPSQILNETISSQTLTPPRVALMVRPTMLTTFFIVIRGSRVFDNL